MNDLCTSMTEKNRFFFQITCNIGYKVISLQ